MENKKQTSDEAVAADGSAPQTSQLIAVPSAMVPSATPHMIMPPPPPCSLSFAGDGTTADRGCYVGVNDGDYDDDDDDGVEIIRNETADLENPSRVRNLRDILKYSTQMTAESAAAANEPVDTIDLTLPEDKRNFLSNVLSTMSVNVHEEMNNSINILLDSKKHVEELEYAFDVIGEYVDNIDYANDFQKIGGFQVIKPGLNSEHPTVRSKTAELIATLVQHNPYCQEKFIEHSTYTRMLMDLVENDPVDEVRVKSLHALSSLVRHNIPAFWHFINLGGIRLIIEAMNSSCDKLKVKAVFQVLSTCHMGNDIADLYVDNGVVEIICSTIMNMEKSLADYHHELFLSTLNQLLRMSPTKVKEICSKFEDLKRALLSLQDLYSRGDTNYQEEKDQIIWLMETLTL